MNSRGCWGGGTEGNIFPARTVCLWTLSFRESKGLSWMNFLCASPSDYTPMFVSTCFPAATSPHGPLQPRALGISSEFVSRTAQTICNLSLGLSVSHHSDSEFSWIQESNKWWRNATVSLKGEVLAPRILKFSIKWKFPLGKCVQL